MLTYMRFDSASLLHDVAWPANFDGAEHSGTHMRSYYHQPGSCRRGGVGTRVALPPSAAAPQTIKQSYLCADAPGYVAACRGMGSLFAACGSSMCHCVRMCAGLLVARHPLFASKGHITLLEPAIIN